MKRKSKGGKKPKKKIKLYHNSTNAWILLPITDIPPSIIPTPLAQGTNKMLLNKSILIAASLDQMAGS